jgi:hypothetical protein
MIPDKPSSDAFPHSGLVKFPDAEDAAGVENPVIVRIERVGMAIFAPFSIEEIRRINGNPIPVGNCGFKARREKQNACAANGEK